MTKITLWSNMDAESDQVLSVLWKRMNHDGLRDTVMYDGHCNTFVDFVLLMSDSLLFVVRSGDEAIGFIWVTELVPGVRAEAHFCFFKQAWGTGIPDEAGRGFIKLMTHVEECNVRVIHGRILDSNKKAIHFVLRLGFEVVGHRFDGRNDLTLVELSGRRCDGLTILDAQRDSPTAEAKIERNENQGHLGVVE